MGIISQLSGDRSYVYDPGPVSFRIVSQLNAYQGDSIWQHLIFVLSDGTVIRWDPQSGQWYVAGRPPPLLTGL